MNLPSIHLILWQDLVSRCQIPILEGGRIPTAQHCELALTEHFTLSWDTENTRNVVSS